jgi:hypothetical protein
MTASEDIDLYIESETDHPNYVRSRPKAELAAAKFDATKPPFKAASKQSGLD